MPRRQNNFDEEPASRTIGIARAAFYPNVSFRLGGGFEGDAFNLFKLASSFWSYGLRRVAAGLPGRVSSLCSRHASILSSSKPNY